MIWPSRAVNYFPANAMEISDTDPAFNLFRSDVLSLLDTIGMMVSKKSSCCEVVVDKRNDESAQMTNAGISIGQPTQFYMRLRTAASCKCLIFRFIGCKQYEVIIESGSIRYAYLLCNTWLMEKALKIVNVAVPEQKETENSPMAVENKFTNNTESVRVAPFALYDVLHAFHMNGIQCTVGKEDGSLMVYYWKSPETPTDSGPGEGNPE